MVSNVRRVMVGVALLMLSVGFSTSVSAQATEEADPRSLVVQAFSKWVLHDGFDFALHATLVTTSTYSDGQTISNAAIYAASGEVATNGGYHAAVSLKIGTSLEEARTNPPLQYERLRVAGITYLNLSSDLIAYLQLMGIDAGWWRYSELISKLDDPTQQNNIETLNEIPLPLEPHWTELSTIDMVTAGETQTVNDRDVRVYNVKLNNLAYLRAQGPENGVYALIQQFDNADLLSSVEMTIHGQYLLGLEDDQLYQATVRVRLLFPDILVSNDSRETYDLLVKSNATYTLDYPDQPVRIKLLDSSLLNH